MKKKSKQPNIYQILLLQSCRESRTRSLLFKDGRYALFFKRGARGYISIFEKEKEIFENVFDGFFRAPTIQEEEMTKMVGMLWFNMHLP